MTASPYQLVTGRETFLVTDRVAGEKFADALKAATGVKPRIVATPDVCAYCRQPIAKYPCRSWICDDRRSADDARVERNCDES